MKSKTDLKKIKNNRITNTQLFSEVLHQFKNIPHKITKNILSSFVNEIERSILDGKKVRIERIGTIRMKEAAQKKGRNPKTGESLIIPAHKKISFKVSKRLKDRVGKINL